MRPQLQGREGRRTPRSIEHPGFDAAAFAAGGTRANRGSFAKISMTSSWKRSAASGGWPVHAPHSREPSRTLTGAGSWSIRGPGWATSPPTPTAIIEAECKGGAIETRHPGRLSRLDKSLCEIVGRLMSTPATGGQVAAMPRTEVTLRLARKLAPRCWVWRASRC
jgi:hypothetical protein